MALQVSTKSPTYPITITIDDEPVRVHVKRLTKDEIVPYRREMARFEIRGSAELNEEARDALQNEAVAFSEDIITKWVTFEPGDVTNDDGPVITGEQIVASFYNRKDVIDALASAVYAENCMGLAQKKILRSLRTLSPGSMPSTKSQVGAEPVSAASPVAPSSSVSAAAVTDKHAANRSGGTEI